MRRGIAVFYLMLILIISLPLSAFADVATFGTTGSGSNPFNPRGYFVTLNDGKKLWISSKFKTPINSQEPEFYDELGHQVQYTGVVSGLDYVEASDVVQLDAQTDRNPTPGYKFLVAYSKDSSAKALTRIENFSDYLQVPGRDHNLADPNGQGYVWSIPIDMKLKPGTVYEFAYLRGIKANNGTTGVLAADNSGYLKTPLTTEEQQLYDTYKYDEYEYVTSATANGDGTYTLTTVPMRWKIQTYADMSSWESTEKAVEAFLDSVKQSDIQSGKYDATYINNIKIMLSNYKTRAGSVKKELQVEADRDQKEMVDSITLALGDAKDDILSPADLSKYNAALSEAEELYLTASKNIGTSLGKYGKEEVENLKAVISQAKKTVSSYTKQSLVDSMTEALKKAVVEVKASKVTESEIKFYDSSTGIYVIASTGALPKNVKLYVAQVTKESTEYEFVEDKAVNKAEEMVLYKILFYVNDEQVQPTEAVRVQMPILNSMTGYPTAVYWVNSSFNTKKLSSKIVNKYHCFTTNKMGTFAMMKYSKTDVTESPKNNEKKENIKVDNVGTRFVFDDTKIPNEQIINKVSDTENKQDTINEMEEQQKLEQQVKQNEAEQRIDKVIDPKDTLFNVTDISRPINENEYIYIGVGLVTADVVFGVVEYIKSKKNKKTYV